jgi:hypothetical protein
VTRPVIRQDCSGRFTPQWGVLLLKHFRKLIIDMSKHLGVEYKVRMPQELKDKMQNLRKNLTAL